MHHKLSLKTEETAKENEATVKSLLVQVQRTWSNSPERLVVQAVRDGSGELAEAVTYT